MSPKRRLFAIGMKGWVELRTASTPPRKRVTTSTVKFKRFNGWNWGGNRPSRKWLEGEKELKVVHFRGGVTLKVVKKAKFKALLGLTIRKDTMIELDPTLTSTTLLDKLIGDL